ncbi:MAG: hypothetical protein E7153_02045 [Enterococcus faecium]|uniref:Lipoprotein n=1 Tax=Enterococcus mundtii TaxID=53346 RepID=A0A2T5DBB1_ENTMU|nr:hypothetical protein [Enterococcus mundtii]MBE6171615.1 hypothetical protein [Enterococcus faecium]PTO34932.1 hypothetical protein C6N14_09775 [Enterococcus mundtii]
MKKIIYIGMLNSLFLLAACETTTSKSTESDTQSKSSMSSTEITTTYKEISSEENLSTFQSSQIQEATNSTPTSEVTTESTAASSPFVGNAITSQERAMQILISDSPELQNEDIVVTFNKMIESDYLFNTQSKSILEQGGSGSVGFYRVSKEGTITITDAYGNAV